MLEELLRSCGKDEDDNEVDFALFARAVALILEENLEADLGEEGEEMMMDGGAEEGDFMEVGNYQNMPQFTGEGQEEETEMAES